MSLNRVILIGRLGQDPEVKNLANDKMVATFSIATDEGFGDKKTVAWHRIVAWDKSAKLAGDYLAKGKEICVEGRLQYRTYEKDGETKYITEVVADRIVFVGKPDSKDEDKPKTQQRSKPARDDDDVPW